MRDQARLNGKYTAYPEYKDSGVEWLGEIPNSWDVIKIKHLSSVKRGASPRPIDDPKYFDEDGDYAWVRIADVTASSTYLEKTTQTMSELGSSLSVRLEPNQLFLSIAGTVGKPCINKIKACIHDGFVYFPELKIPNKYLFYVFAGELAYKGLGKMGTQLNLNTDTVGDIKVALPKQIEQIEQIAAFLDYETARIDSLIDKQQRLIELLKEKRQAVISNVVSVREGEISAKLSYFVDLLPGYAFPSSGFKNEADGNIPLLRGVNVGVGKLKWEETVWWPKAEKAEQEALKDFELQEGDIVFGMDRPWIAAGARVAEVTSTDLPCLLLQRVARIRTYEDTYQPFVTLCLSSYEFKSFVEADLTGVSVPHISPDQIKSFSIRVIGFDKQKAETDTALKLCKELEAIEAKAWSAISLMQERRTALIAAAVTGKIDLRGWTPPVEEDAA
ncbi:restriction endonuclease subunit S [Shewanella sp. BJSY2023SW001]|uniref:restriction endonuclease subunit S n=1 Tax=Shewanella sp. BJSY2023SW001 TaxID=3392039 RepID=UPI0039B3C052